MPEVLLALSVLETEYSTLLAESHKLNSKVDEAISEHFIKMQRLSTKHLELIRKMTVIYEGIQSTKKLLR